MNDTSFVTWKLETSSAEKVSELEEFLKPVVDLNSVFTDQIITLQDEKGTVHLEQHRLSDYFERLCILPGTYENLHAIRLFFQRKASAGRYWKDVMASVLKKARQSPIPSWIGLDYRVDDEELKSAAVQIPKWFSHLGVESRKFWKISATYLLKHPRFTFADLENFSGISIPSLRSMHKNSYKAIKREKSPNPLWQRWDHVSKEYVYTMEPVVRDEILCLTSQDSGKE